jgi:hypothetical protein
VNACVILACSVTHTLVVSEETHDTCLVPVHLPVRSSPTDHWHLSAWMMPHSSIVGFHTTTIGKFDMMMVNWRPDGAFRGEKKIIGWEGRKE